MKHQIQLLGLIADESRFGADELPREVRLLKWGKNSTRKGPVSVGSKTLSLLPLAQAELGFDRVAIDFEHNSLPGTEAWKESREPRDVAAFGVPTVRDGDGLYLTDIEWTPIGKEKARNFADFSPAVKLDESGEVVFLHSTGLCRQGAVDGLRAFAVDLAVQTEDKTNSEDKTMEALLIALRKWLGLGDDANEAAVVEALEKKMGAVEKGVTDLSAQNAGAALSELKGQITALSAELAGLKVGQEQRDLNEIVAQACREGKVVPLSAEQVAATPIPTLREMVEKLPVTVPMDRRTPTNVQAHSANESGLSEAEKRVCRVSGVSEEAFKKAKG
jgi:phage I-like protein